MNKSGLRGFLWVLASVLVFSLSNLAHAEPPLRAARLAYIGGTVSFAPAGQPDWLLAAVNRPLTTGDRLWTNADSRAEVQIGGAAIRMGPSTSLVVLNLDDRITQVQLSEGTLKVRVRSVGPDQSLEVATPNLAFTLRRAGEYRIEVDPDDDATAVLVQSGAGDVFGENASYAITQRSTYRFYGTGLSDYEIFAAARDDDLDRWSRERDQRWESSVSARYVSPEVVGYEDLDGYGTWRVDPTYGNVWMPSRVAAGWTPYRDGHWAWVDPWGWTWVDDAPWGYAVSHYGRWAHLNNAWAWVPGPRQERAVYAPALVAFVGGANFQISVTSGGAMPAAVGWFPLAPREVYQPSYRVSRAYFDRINRSNAVIAPQVITNVYNTTNVTNVNNVTNVVYVNQRVNGAVVAVPPQAFAQSQSVARSRVQVSQEIVARAPVARMAQVAPVQQSLQGGARVSQARPPARERGVIVRAAPPTPPVPFAAQQQQLAAKPGAPIDDATRTRLRPQAPAQNAPRVRVVAAAPAPAATAEPPARPPSGRSPDERRAAAAPRGEAGKVEPGRPEAPRPDAPRPEANKGEPVPRGMSKDAPRQVDDGQAARARADAAKAQRDSAEAAKADAAKADAAKAENARADAAREAAVRANPPRPQQARPEQPRPEQPRLEQARPQQPRPEQARPQQPRPERAPPERAEADPSSRKAGPGGRKGDSDGPGPDDRKNDRDEPRRR